MMMNIVAIALHTITVANDTIMVVQLLLVKRQTIASLRSLEQIETMDQSYFVIITELVYNKEQERCFAAMPMPSRPDITYRITDNDGSALTPKIIERGHWLNFVRLHEGRKKAKGILLLPPKIHANCSLRVLSRGIIVKVRQGSSSPFQFMDTIISLDVPRHRHRPSIVEWSAHGAADRTVADGFSQPQQIGAWIACPR